MEFCKLLRSGSKLLFFSLAATVFPTTQCVAENPAISLLKENDKILPEVQFAYISLAVTMDSGEQSVASETWVCGRSQKARSHTLMQATPSGEEPIPNGGLVTLSCINSEGLHKQLVGWNDKAEKAASGANPDIHPLLHVKGKIAKSTPGQQLSLDWSRLLVEVWPGTTALEAAQAGACRIVKEADKNGVVVVEVESVRDGSEVNFTCAIDTSRGHAITELVWDNGIRLVASDFVGPFSESLWIPRKVTTSINESDATPRPLTVIQVDSLSINEPIDCASLDLDFPEGIRVDDMRTPSPIIHLWGKGKPAVTFDSVQAFVSHAQGLTEVTASTNRSSSEAALPQGETSRLYIWVNAGLVIILVILVLAKKKLTAS